MDLAILASTTIIVVMAMTARRSSNRRVCDSGDLQTRARRRWTRRDPSPEGAGLALPPTMSLLFAPPNDDRGSSPPLAMDMAAAPPPTGLRALLAQVPPAWVGMSGYLFAGVFLGLVLILAISLARPSEPSHDASAGVVTDNVVRLHGRDVGAACWSGVTKDGPARVTVSMEVGLDGKVRSAIASGESPAMRSCVEAHVKSWEFLPQAQAQAMVLPFEIDR
jgi:hypothetical protein